MSDEAPAAADAAAEAPPPPRKGKPGLVLIGALVGGLIAGAAAGLFGVGPVVARTSGYVVTDEMTARVNAQARLIRAAQGHDEEDEEGAEGEHGEEGAAEGEAGAEGAGGEHAPAEGGGGSANLHLVDNLVLNPSGSGGTRFLMLSAAIEFRESAMVDQFKARDAEVRDLVLRVVGARTVEQLSEMSLREQIRKEVTDSLAGLIPKKVRKRAITRVYFPQFVIQ